MNSLPLPPAHQLVAFPPRPAIWIDATPFSTFAERYRSNDEAAVNRVTSTLAEAARWSSRPDAWFLDTIWHREPRGYRTHACPIHPLRVRYYNSFEWSLDDPWRLYCPYCKAEGREYDYYPNPRYPDEGDGCFPTDAVWREDHDEAWSRAHDGIPWDHWDGEVHGEMEPTNAYYFRGLCWLNAYLALSGNVLQSLGESAHFAGKLMGDEDTARLCARKGRLILLTLSRAFLGDAYLAGIVGATEQQFTDRLARFYDPDADPRSYPGYRLFTMDDRIAGDPDRPFSSGGGRSGTKMATLWPGIWSWKANQARALMTGYSLLAETFTDEEVALGLRDAALRIVTSVDGDPERIAAARAPGVERVKRGVIEYTLHPHALITGGDNLSTSTQMPRLALGRMTGDHRVIANVARDIDYFLHNFFTGDGMGKEGSPSYSSWGIATVMDAVHGQTVNADPDGSNVGPDVRWYDTDLGGINLLALPVFRHAIGSYLYTCFPSGRPISWEDCVIRAGVPLSYLELVEAKGGGILDPYRRYLQIASNADGHPTVSLRLPLELPSRILGENRKGILRSGKGENARALSIDFTERVGHYHMAPLNLTLFAKGRELATDLGYMGSDHFMTVDWIRTFPAHNTVAIRTEDGDPMGTDNLRGDLRWFTDLAGVRAIDAAEEDPAELATIPGTDCYHRTTALIDVDDEDAYVVDFFRVSGGHLHDWTFHSNGHSFTTDAISLAPVPDAEQSLYDYSRFTFTPERRKKALGAKWGSQRVTALRTGTSAGPWTATWGDVTEYPEKDAPPVTDSDVFLKLHMLDAEGSEVIAGAAPAQRWLDNRDLGEQMTVVTVRRPAADSPTTFAAVLEPYRTSTFIQSVTPLPVTALSSRQASGRDPAPKDAPPSRATESAASSQPCHPGMPLGRDPAQNDEVIIRATESAAGPSPSPAHSSPAPKRPTGSPLSPYAVTVTHKAGTDILLSAASPDSIHTTASGDHTLTTDAELAVASWDSHGLRTLTAISGTFAEADGRRIEVPSDIESTLLAFDDVKKTLTMSAAEVPPGDMLKGSIITIRHRERTSAFTITSTEALSDGTTRIHLDGFPHLALNYLAVTEVTDDRAWVEPPPVIQGKTSHLNLFRVESDRTLTFLQPLGERGSEDIVDEWGTRIRPRSWLALDDPAALSSSVSSSGGLDRCELALSPLHPGKDRARITRAASWSR